jgi:small-conductance mechanosensitive channel
MQARLARAASAAPSTPRMDLNEFLQRTFLGNTVLAWLVALGILVAGVGLLAFVKRIALSRLAAFAQRSSNQVDDLVIDLLQRTRFAVMTALVCVGAAATLVLPAGWNAIVRYVLVIALCVQGMSWGNGIVSFWMHHYAARRGMTTGAGASTLAALVFFVRLVLFFVLLLVALENLGIEVTGLITGLGIGGVAVALAVQNILGDLFAALSIVLDKPFVVGDFIIVDTVQGTVEHIGLKSTRLRSLSGEQIIVSNGDLLRSRVRNYKRMVERRAVFMLGVTYETSADQLARIPVIVREAVTDQQQTRFDRCHFLTYGDFSLNFETVYWILSSEFNVYADIQQAINLEIFRRFAAEGIEFAYPTQTVVVRRDWRGETTRSPSADGGAAIGG